MSDYVSSSSAASSSRSWKYDVFLSFRGKDTRKNFVSHLYDALQKKGIYAFKDDERVETGKSFPHELLKAIEKSRFSVVIFSKNYASSKWCLKELAHIIKCKDELDQIVLPIFYDVNPSDVRHQNAPFAKSFSKHEKKCKCDMEKVQRWKAAFAEAGKLSGYHLQNFKDEADCIKKLIDDIFPKLLKVISPFPENFVGTQIEKVKSLLNLDSNHDVRSIGIWGMGGIGKTEIASCLHLRYRHKFDVDCFLGDVGASCTQENGLRCLAQLLICKLLGEKITLTSEHEGVTIIKNMLRHKKVLLILDNVSHQEQLECLAGDPEWFGRGSRIIITARDKRLLISHVGDNMYEVQLLTESEALELFSRHAFKEKSPKEYFMELSRQVVHYAGRLPLALKVLGSFFYGRDREQYMDIIDRLMKIPNNDILAKLRISFDGLEKDVKEMFLDMACLYKNDDKNYVELVLQSRGIKRIVIDYLAEKSLLSITGGHGFEMHNLIRDMGENISREEYTNSRIWLKEEVHDLFVGNLETEKVESLWIQKSYEFEDDHVKISKVFKRMKSLQGLRIEDETFSSNCTVTHLPSSLRFVDWLGYPSSSLPENFKPSQLVVLRLHNSRLVELWPVPKKLSKLKHLDLSRSLELTKTPNFSEMPNLEKLIMRECENLKELHPSLGHCSMLKVLDLWGCIKLEKLPKFVSVESLERLVLPYCKSLKKFPKTCGDMRHLSSLSIESPWVRTLPPSLSGLTYLHMICEALESIPNTITQNLTYLSIHGCSKLTTLPRSLEVHNKLVTLCIYKCENLKKLPNSIQMESLERLEICNCPKLATFPEINGDMQRLSFMSLSYTGFKELPSSIGNLSGLTHLFLDGCKDLVSLPNSICNLNNLQRLYLHDCKKLEKLPENIGNLSGLTNLDLEGCEDLVSLPNSLCNLKNLQQLNLNDCKKLEKLPENIGDLQLLEKLTATETAMSQPVPPSFTKLCKLQFLEFSSFVLPQVSSLSSLTHLHLTNCNILGEDLVCLSSLISLELCNSNIKGGLPEDIGSLHSLEILNVSGSNISYLPKSISKLLRLISLNVQFCKSLSELPGELPPNLEELFADDHLALKSIRDLLVKCVKLDEISFSESTECKPAPTNQNLLKFLGHFLRTFIQHHFHQRGRLRISFPIGGRIPESSGRRFLFNLNPSWYTDDFMGFLICFCVNGNQHSFRPNLTCKLLDPERKHPLKHSTMALFSRSPPSLIIFYVPFKTLWDCSHNKRRKQPNDYCLFEVSTLEIATCLRIYLEYENETEKRRRTQRATQSPELIPNLQLDNAVTTEIGCSMQMDPSHVSSQLQAYDEHNFATDMGLHVGYEVETLEVDHATMAVQKEHETQLTRVCDGPLRKMGDASRKRKRKRSKKRKKIIKEASISYWIFKTKKI